MCKPCTIILFCCLLFNSGAAQISPDSLVLYLPLNGDAKDYSGNNNNGTIIDAKPTAGFDGQKNGAFNFDGNSAIVIPNLTTLDGPLKAFSLLMRIQPSIPRRDGVPFYNFFTWQRHGPDPSYNYIHGKLRVGWSPPSPNYHPLYDFLGYFGDWCSNNENTANGYEMDTASANGQWQSIAIVYSEGNMRVYFNCTVMSDWVNAFAKVSDLCGTYPMEIILGNVAPGRPGGTNFKNFLGKIDEVRFYKRALTHAEVLYFADSVCRQAIAPKPAISAAANPCQPNEFGFSDTLSVISNAYPVNRHVWQISNGDSVAGRNVTYRFMQPGMYRVRLKLYTEGGVFTKDTAIQVTSLQPVRFIKTAQANVFSCAGASVQLHADGGASYSWQPCAGLSDCNTASPSFKSDNDITFTVTAKNANKCIDTAHINVKVINNSTPVHIPNAFTPNGDGHNDSWGVSSANPLQSFNLRIFNRWGINVFTAGGQDDKWNGYTNNAKAPPGAYVYILTYKNGAGCPVNNTKGTVLLIQ